VTILDAIPVKHYVTIDSTNLEAHRLYASGERGPLYLLADEQTAGKGRLGRPWASASGNLYATLLLPVLKADTVAQSGFAVALAVADTIEAHADVKAQLKWPNDVLVRGAKISGILSEVVAQDPLTVAIGCGINVAHAPFGLPYPATCLAGEGAVATRDEVFKTYQARLSVWLQKLNNNFSSVRECWQSRAIGFGEVATLTVGNAVHSGRFEGIADDGAILIKLANTPLKSFHAGDLVIPTLQHLRKTST
jgi:BirA family biotin operon repressor/biotin-[acetyl-CoA-carboxylase] ligase